MEENARGRDSQLGCRREIEGKRGGEGVELIRGGGKQRQSRLLEGRRLSCASYPPYLPVREGT